MNYIVMEPQVRKPFVYLKGRPGIPPGKPPGILPNFPFRRLPAILDICLVICCIISNSFSRRFTETTCRPQPAAMRFLRLLLRI